MTSNIEAPNRNEAMVETIRSIDPDVLAIQELSHWQASRLSEALKPTFPYQRLLPGERFEGIGLFSRYPITEILFEQQGSDLGAIQHVRLAVNGRELGLMNVHPWPPRLRLTQASGIPLPVDYDTSARDARIDTLVSRLDAERGTVLAVGDFNLADREPRYQELTSRFRDAQREAGWGFGFTFPAEIGRRGFSFIPSVVRIDYVFYDPSLAARSVEVGRMPGSDHRYVVADLVLPAIESGR